GRERMSEALIQQLGLEVLVGTGKVSPKYAGALSLLSNLAINLPHSRGQESEADKIGLDLMARAGYNPESAVDLWQKMKAAGGGQPPEFLSTHPANDTRINQIKALLPKVMPLYKQAAS
ncbi:MAG: M48 family metallopeptidase, partial [Bdellovibrionales bacterium]